MLSENEKLLINHLASSKLLHRSPEEISSLRTKVWGKLLETERSNIDEVLHFLDRSDYFTAPASSKYHGAFPGGLAAHSDAIYETFKQRVEQWNLGIRPESIAIVSYLHDLCKIHNYTINVEGLNTGKPYKIIPPSYPYGHGEKSVDMISEFITLTRQEKMLIRWHMGMYDPAFKDYANDIGANYPEVIVFHNVDNEVSQILHL